MTEGPLFQSSSLSHPPPHTHSTPHPRAPPDHDGQITPRELAAAVGPTCSPQQAAALVAAADKDGDGRISKREFNDIMKTHFGTA